MEILVTEPSKDYELIDSGEGEKIERYGNFVLSRPDPQAIWPKRLPKKIWDSAHGVFLGSEKTRPGWKLSSKMPERWPIEMGELKFWVRPSPFKHTGVFPEQSENWRWVSEIIKNSGHTPAVLNLFGYTGGATLASLLLGASVVHVDSSKVAITWAKDNVELSGFSEKPVRWILEDTLSFVRREVRRGNKYDGIILDPPAFGRGAKGEIWKIEKNLPELLELCFELLPGAPLFFLLNGYASGYSAISYKNNLFPLTARYGGEISFGELSIRESGDDCRLLPAGIFARWSSSI